MVAAVIITPKSLALLKRNNQYSGTLLKPIKKDSPKRSERGKRGECVDSNVKLSPGFPHIFNNQFG